MIKSFRDRDAEALFRTGQNRRYGELSRRAFQKLRMSDAATSLGDLRALPGNWLEPLQGKRRGQHSIRINDQFRICFQWRDSDAHEVEITGYH